MRIALIVDNPYRDLPGLTLLAYYLCSRGATCFLVPMNLREREIWSLAPDYVLLHQLRANTQEFARKMISADILVGILDTEGGVMRSIASYKELIAHDNDVRRKITHLFTWGTKLSEYVTSQNLYGANQVFVTGSPRTDVYAYPWRNAALEYSAYANRYPRPMVLVNGNFPLANPQFNSPEQEVAGLVKWFGYDESEMIQWQESQEKSMRQLSMLTNNLAKHFPHATFIYRPHPFEKTDTYRDLLDERDNLHIIKQGTVDGWILRSIAVIQRGCTTAIEAGLAGVPALSPSWLDMLVTIKESEDVSIRCKDEEALTNNLKEALDGNLSIPPYVKSNLDTVVSDWFYSTDGQAHQRIGDNMISSLGLHKPPVRIDVCRDRYYIIGQRSLLSRLTLTAKKHLGIAPQWSFSRWGYVSVYGETHPEKRFDLEQVKTITGAIKNSLVSSLDHNPRDVRIETAADGNHYKFSNPKGRSIALSLA